MGEVMNAKQEWESIYGERAIEILEADADDLAHALAACMEWLEIEYGRIGDYLCYRTSDGAAAAIRIDDNGDRLPSKITELRGKR